jgi:hypothetical protein
MAQSTQHEIVAVAMRARDGRLEALVRRVARRSGESLEEALERAVDAAPPAARAAARQRSSASPRAGSR